MRGDTFTISILCRSHFWECANTRWLAFVSWMFNEGLAHRKFFTIMQAARTWVISVYMFSKLSILLFVLPFLTSRNVLYLSVPDLSTSLGKKTVYQYHACCPTSRTSYKRWLTWTVLSPPILFPRLLLTQGLCRALPIQPSCQRPSQPKNTRKKDNEMK